VAVAVQSVFELPRTWSLLELNSNLIHNSLMILLSNIEICRMHVTIGILAPFCVCLFVCVCVFVCSIGDS
jgi:hypothetical protein